MKRKLLWSSLAIAAAATLVGTGTFATFVDTDEAPTVNIETGTLQLEVGGAAATVDYSFDNAFPGQVIAPAKGYVLTNTGSLDGELHVYLVKDADGENGMADPESDLPDTDLTGGELDDFLGVTVDGNTFGYGGAPATAVLGLNTVPVGGSIDITGWIWGPNPKPLAAGERYPAAPFELWFGWKIDPAATNVIQSDTLAFHLEFVLEQA